MQKSRWFMCFPFINILRHWVIVSNTWNTKDNIRAECNKPVWDTRPNHCMLCSSLSLAACSDLKGFVLEGFIIGRFLIDPISFRLYKKCIFSIVHQNLTIVNYFLNKLLLDFLLGNLLSNWKKMWYYVEPLYFKRIIFYFLSVWVNASHRTPILINGLFPYSVFCGMIMAFKVDFRKHFVHIHYQN